MTTLLNRMRTGGNWVAELTAEGKVFYASDSAQNTTVTGQTSFAATTPTFELDVPSGTTALPLMHTMHQAGSVAGGAVTVVMEIDNAARRASGGTAETILNARTTGGATANSVFYSNPTTTDAYGVNVFRALIGPDVSTAEGAVNEVLWTPSYGAPPLLVGPASFLVYSYAASTGPTWLWSFQWAEMPTGEAV